MKCGNIQYFETYFPQTRNAECFWFRGILPLQMRNVDIWKSGNLKSGEIQHREAGWEKQENSTHKPTAKHEQSPIRLY